MNITIAPKANFLPDVSATQGKDKTGGIKALTQLTAVSEAKDQKGAVVNSDEIIRATSEINDVVAKTPHRLHFNLDEDTGRPVVTVIDRETNEVIKQIPAEEVLEISRHLEKMTGLLLKTEA